MGWSRVRGCDYRVVLRFMNGVCRCDLRCADFVVAMF